MPASFLPLEANDIDRAVGMMAKLYAQDGGSFDAARARQATAKLLSEPEFGGVWLIEMGSAVAGYVVLVLGYSLEFGGRFGLLDELFVEEPFRGHGIGSQALVFAEQQSLSRGWKALRLEVGQKNERAIALYGRGGFQMHDRFLMTKWM